MRDFVFDKPLRRPALSVKEFANYQQDLIVGISLQASAPLGNMTTANCLTWE
jgi:hypothetical protein